jgi:hypothetical protein
VITTDPTTIAQFVNASAGGYYGLSVIDWLVGGIGAIILIVGVVVQRDFRVAALGAVLLVVAAVMNYMAI